MKICSELNPIQRNGQRSPHPCIRDRTGGVLRERQPGSSTRNWRHKFSHGIGKIFDRVKQLARPLQAEALKPALAPIPPNRLPQHMCLCQVVRPRMVPAIYPVNKRQPSAGPRILLEVFFIAIQRPSPRRSRPISQSKRSSSRSWRLWMLPRARGIRHPTGRHDDVVGSRHRGRQKTRRLGQYERNGRSGIVGFDSINRPVYSKLRYILVPIHLVHVPDIRCRECPAVISLARRPADAISDLKDQRSSVGNFPRAGQIACNRLPMRIGFVVRNEHDQLAVQQLQDRRSPAERNLLPRSHDRRPKPRTAPMQHQSPSPSRAIPAPRKILQASPMVPPPPLLKVNPLMRDHHRPFAISRRQRHTGSSSP